MCIYVCVLCVCVCVCVCLHCHPFLQTFLPTFPESSDQVTETQETLSRLFSQESFHFGSPLQLAWRQLNAGEFLKDMAQMKAEQKRQQKRLNHQERRNNFLKMFEILFNRHQVSFEKVLLAAVSNSFMQPYCCMCVRACACVRACVFMYVCVLFTYVMCRCVVCVCIVCFCVLFVYCVCICCVDAR